jgi:hypothetical protein
MDENVRGERPSGSTGGGDFRVAARHVPDTIDSVAPASWLTHKGGAREGCHGRDHPARCAAGSCVNRPPIRTQLIAGAIVAGVAFLTSGALAFFIAASGAPRTTPTWLTGLCLGVVAGAIYLALSGNRSVRAVDGPERDRALAGAAPDAAQILVYREGFVGKLAGVDVSVDGVVRTQLKSPRFAALAVSPGRHDLVASAQGRSSPPAQVEVGAGETAVVRIAMGLSVRLTLIRETDVAGARRKLAGVAMVAA